jgi:3-oxoacyl-[acyl-carrier protein] reductase
MVTASGKALQGKVALVTGGVRRIGRAIALALAEEGCAVAINARSSREEAEAAAADVAKLGVRSGVFLADITKEADVAAMIADVVASFGRLDILINNAAIRKDSTLEEMTYADWRSVLDIVLDGAFLCARAAIPHMRKAGGGTIVNIGGMTAHTGAADRAHVVTAKAGLVGLTKALAVEFAGDGITVNCVAPGKIGGKRSATSGAGGKIPGSSHPLVGREGTFEEVAAMVRTLCLPTGKFITGQTIHVNGGLYLP